MKIKSKTVKTTAYVAGIFAIGSAMMLAVLLLLSSAGIIFPRRERITLYTATLSKIYDEAPLSGGEPIVTHGFLHDGHELVILAERVYTDVGEYVNKPDFLIVDASGDDVTEMYDIHEDFGNIVISGRPITVYSKSKSKRYDGTPLVSDEIAVSGGNLLEGHTFISNSTTDITMPGEQKIQPAFSIINQNGADVTDQYRITDLLGELTVLPLTVNITTASAEKTYDGEPLALNEWEHVGGDLLEGHRISAKCITKVSDVGEYANELSAQILDETGKDVSEIYEVSVSHGTLKVSPLPLYIQTGSVSKEYDGDAVSCETWSISSGKLNDSESIALVSAPEVTDVGNVKNEMVFVITDRNGTDITHRYEIIQNTGIISVTPRALTVRTKSASKVYDGEPLVCEEYEIVKGTLLEGDTFTAAFTSIVNIGYSENYIIEYSVRRRNQQGFTADISSNYRVSFDYGTLTITAN